jgi:TonB family protein
MSGTAAALLSYTSRRGGIWLIIAAVHMVLIYAVTSWSPVVAMLNSTPIEASILEETPRPEVAPPPPAPQIVSLTPPTMDPPLISITEEPPPNAITVAAVESAPRPQPEAAPHVVTDVEYLQAPAPKFPSESKRFGEEGLVVLRVLIDESGRAARIDIEHSSGYARLDAAARAAVERALFQPYVENGVPRKALAMVPIEFTWKSRSGGERPRRG